MGKRNNRFCHLSKTERKGESGHRMCWRMLPGPGVGHLADGAELGTPGTITGLWGPHYCSGAWRWAFWCGLSCVTSGRWRLTSFPCFSPGTQCMGQFGGRHRKNSKSLTYSIFQVEKDQTVTKINNFSIVFWWPWARWPRQGCWRG